MTVTTEPRVAPRSRSLVGQTLGNYRIVSEIGQGGMGVVYLAEHEVIGRKVAVKVLRNDVQRELVERFLIEARAAAKLQHPGLVEVFDFGHDAHGSAYIVMEFLAGESLAERLDRDPRLPIPLACSIARQVASALQVAHGGGIVHRDLKPGNIYLVPDADSPVGVRTKVLDFGIAKLTADRDERSTRTHSGALIGTPRYMSPEQCKNARNVDGRSDIYALGCLVYEMLLGVAPFDYDTWAELVGAHLHEQPPRPTDLDPAVPADVERLLIKMLEKNPEHRPRSMQELAQAIDGLLRTHAGSSMRFTPATGVRTTPHDVRSTDPTFLAVGEPTPSGERIIRPPTPVPAPAPAPAKRTPWLAIGIAAAGAIGLAAAAVIAFGRSHDDKPAETAYVVVDHEGSAPSPQPRVAVPADAAVVAPPADAVETTRALPTKPLTQSEQLERAFAKQRGAIATCFRDHPGDAAGEVAVRFQIDKTGTVKAAEIIPDTVAKTALGACLTDVAKRTAFGPQPKAATFRIPIHAAVD